MENNVQKKVIILVRDVSVITFSSEFQTLPNVLCTCCSVLGECTSLLRKWLFKASSCFHDFPKYSFYTHKRTISKLFHQSLPTVNLFQKWLFLPSLYQDPFTIQPTLKMEQIGTGIQAILQRTIIFNLALCQLLPQTKTVI